MPNSRQNFSGNGNGGNDKESPKSGVAIWKSAAAIKKPAQGGPPTNGNTTAKEQKAQRQADSTKELVKAVPARAVLTNNATGGDVDSLKSEFNIKFAIDLEAKDKGKILEIVKR